LFGDLDGARELAVKAVSLATRASRPCLVAPRLGRSRAHARRLPRPRWRMREAPRTSCPRRRSRCKRGARKHEGAPRAALELYRQACALALRPEYLLETWRLATQLGDAAQATRSLALLQGIAQLDAVSGARDRRSVVEYLLLAETLPAAAETLAREEWRSRPDIYSEGQLAWVLFRAGKLAEARTHAAAAIAYDTPDPDLRWRAGTVLAAAGDARGAELVRQARTVQSHAGRPTGLGGSVTMSAARRLCRHAAAAALFLFGLACGGNAGRASAGQQHGKPPGRDHDRRIAGDLGLPAGLCRDPDPGGDAGRRP
jgi:hypothetical protein